MVYHLLAVLLSGCSSSETAMGDPIGPPSAPVGSVPERSVDLRIDVVPINVRDTVDSPYRVLPQSLLPGKVRTSAGVDVGEVDLLPPVVQTGIVEAFRVNPFIGTLPGTVVPLDGKIDLRRLDTVQWYSAETNDLGSFEAWSVPGTYRLEIVPRDPLLPIFTGAWTIEDPPAPIVLDLEAGAPIYGLVTSAAGPVPNIRLHVEDEFGARSADALTDAFGRYQLRVTPGQWTLVCEGRSSGKDPTLRYPELEVGEAGLELDVAYPTELASAFLEGRIEGPSGEPLEDATIRIVADSLDGYESQLASWSFELASNDTGGFVSPIVPGTFTVEVTPAEDESFTPFRLTDVVVNGSLTTLDPIRLGEFRTIRGQIRGPRGNGLEAAQVTCSEVGFDGRSWLAFTDQGGEYELDVPDVTVECQADPPGDRDDLARQWHTLEAQEGGVSFDLPVGERVTGRVLANGAPEPYVIVDVLDLTGRSLGSGLTLEDGDFSIAVDLQSAQ